MEKVKLTDREKLIARIEKRINYRRKNIANATDLYQKMMKKLQDNLALDIIQLNALKK